MGIRDNQMLASLDDGDFARLSEHLEAVDLPFGVPLYEPDDVADYVYFPTSGIISIILTTPDERQQEVGIYGRDGFGSTAVLLGEDRTAFRHIVQYAGRGVRIPSPELRAAYTERPNILRALLKYVQVFSLQVSYSAFAIGHCTVEERLARWLLMCHDRIAANHLTLTHEFLSAMMSVRRSSVTEATHLLEARHLIRASRGNIQILDRAGLERLAGEAYGPPERAFVRLMGVSPANTDGHLDYV